MLTQIYLKLFSKRALSFMLTFILTYILISSLIFISPGKQFYRLINPKMSAELIKQLKEKESISFWHSSGEYFLKLIEGDLGNSTRYNDRVSNVVFEHLKVTITISLFAFISQFILCIIIATYLSQHPKSLFDRIADKISSVFYSLSTIVVAPILILIFSVLLKIFPISGYPSYINSSNPIEIFLIYMKHLALPIISLVISIMPMYYKYFREILYDISNQTYVTYLKTLGLSKNKIYLKTIIPNSMNIVLSIVGVDLGLLLSGSLITEIIFGIPGIGRLFFEAIFAKDYSLTIACAIYSSFIFLFINFIIDFLRIILDKRLLYSLK